MQNSFPFGLNIKLALLAFGVQAETYFKHYYIVLQETAVVFVVVLAVTVAKQYSENTRVFNKRKAKV